MNPMDEIKVGEGGKITAPWGSFNPADEQPDLKLLQFCIDQLKFYIVRGDTPDPEYTASELEGYIEIQKHQDAELTKEFFHLRRATGVRLSVGMCIEVLKHRGRMK